MSFFFYVSKQKNKKFLLKIDFFNLKITRRKNHGTKLPISLKKLSFHNNFLKKKKKNSLTFFFIHPDFIFARVHF